MHGYFLVFWTSFFLWHCLVLDLKESKHWNLVTSFHWGSSTVLCLLGFRWLSWGENWRKLTRFLIAVVRLVAYQGVLGLFKERKKGRTRFSSSANFEWTFRLVSPDYIQFLLLRQPVEARRFMEKHQWQKLPSDWVCASTSLVSGSANDQAFQLNTSTKQRTSKVQHEAQLTHLCFSRRISMVNTSSIVLNSIVSVG